MIIVHLIGEYWPPVLGIVLGYALAGQPLVGYLIR